MAHFAELDDNNKVINIHLVANEVLMVDGAESEDVGIEFLKDFFQNPDGKYIQASYNGTIRKNYPAVGYIYNKVRDAFIAPKPYPSWIFNEEQCTWVPPVPKPAYKPKCVHIWDEMSLSWHEVTVETDI
jgi:hypothetical protein